MKWFGQTWHAPVNDPREQVTIPLGERCAECNRAFTQDDQGVSLPHWSGRGELRASYHRGCLAVCLGLEPAS